MFGKSRVDAQRRSITSQRPFRAMDDLSLLSDREIESLLAEVAPADATVAILEMSEELRDRFFHAMPASDVTRIRKEWKAMKSIDASRATTIRERVLSVANRLSPAK